MNHKKLRRLYREERLHGASARRAQASAGDTGTDGAAAGAEPALDRSTSCRDTLTDGRRFRILAVVDDFTRECLALVADTSLSGVRVAPRTRCAHRRGAAGR